MFVLPERPFLSSRVTYGPTKLFSQPSNCVIPVPGLIQLWLVMYLSFRFLPFTLFHLEVAHPLEIVLCLAQLKKSPSSTTASTFIFILSFYW